MMMGTDPGVGNRRGTNMQSCGCLGTQILLLAIYNAVVLFL